MMQKTIYIVGAGSVGGHIASNKELYNLQSFEIAFVDDDPKKWNTIFCNYPVIGPINKLLEVEISTSVIIGIAFPRIKFEIIQNLKQNPNLTFPSLVSNRSWISNDVHIGEGAIIYPGVSINYGSKIKDFVVINMNCSLGHHVEIGDYGSLSPGVNLGGHTVVGDATLMGIGSCTLQGVIIGKEAIIGGQCMVTKNVDDNLTIVGVPARVV